MLTRRTTLFGLLFALMICSAIGQDTSHSHSRSGHSDVAPQSSTSKIENALESLVDVAYVDVRLKDVIEDLKIVTRIPVLIDHKALIAEGISQDQTVTLNLKCISCRNFLTLLLEPLLLTTVIEDGVLKITTTTVADAKLYSRTYHVADLVEGDVGIETEQTCQELVTAIKLAIPSTWGSEVNNASINSDRDAKEITVRQTQKGHREIGFLMAAIRKSKRSAFRR